MKKSAKTLASLSFILCLSLFLTPPAWALKVALVLDQGGKDDKSFNASAYAGALKAQKDFGIELKYVEATDNNAFENLHRQFARKNFDLIIGVGFSQAEAMTKVAQQFPKIPFAIVDSKVKAPNVRSLLFEEHEGSYLVGMAAALASKTQVVSFIGGMDIPLIRRFAKGFKAGAQSVSPKIKILENFVGVSGEAWNNPAKAKELALSQFGQKSDVIFVAAGASGTGVFDAAEEKKIYAIGVDSNQNGLKPGTILTSMIKSVDVAVYETIRLVHEKKFAGGPVRFGLANKGVAYAVDKNNEKILKPDMIQKIEVAKAQIISGKIQVPDEYKKGASK